MFDELSSRFEDAVKGLRGEAKISENNIDDALKKVKRALLDADVSLSVVKEFISDVKDKAIGEEVVRGVNPGQKFIEVVNKELINIMGIENSPLNENENSPTVILMAGLQGAGKTTATGKLGLYLKEKDKKVLLVAADNYRIKIIFTCKIQCILDYLFWFTILFFSGKNLQFILTSQCFKLLYSCWSINICSHQKNFFIFFL